MNTKDPILLTFKRGMENKENELGPKTNKKSKI